MRTILMLAGSMALVACGAAPPPERSASIEAQPAIEVSAQSSGPPTDVGAAAAAVEPAPRLEVSAPADLGAAITARLPTIELIPQSCAAGWRAIEVTSDRLCLVDTEAGVVRAMRRIAASSERAVWAARVDNDVIFTVSDQGGATTRYNEHAWRWSLESDTYVGLAGLGETNAAYVATVAETSFGALINAPAVDRAWLFAHGELRQIRSLEEVPETLYVSEGHTYAITVSGRHRYAVSEVTNVGPRVVMTRLGSYPVAGHLPLTVTFPAGRSLVVSAFPRGPRTSVYVMRPPAREVTEFTVAVQRPRAARVSEGHLELRTEDAVFRVDLETGDVSPAEVWSPPNAPLRFEPRSFHSVLPYQDAVVLGTYSGSFRIDANGATPLEVEGADGNDDTPDPPRSGCRCEDEAMHCGAVETPGACTRVPALERLSGDLGNAHRPTLYAPHGTYRTDRLEPDLLRVTRLSDGARLWVRLTGSGVFAQADDGAFVMPDSEDPSGLAIRWGRSLLDAPVTPLAPYREAFLRPTLIADFFAGRPLPAADTTLPGG